MIESFKETNGEEMAMALAESLFSNDFATKDDIKGLRTELKDDISGLRTELKDDIKGLRAEIKSNFRWMMGGFFGMFGSMVTLFSVAMAAG